MSETNTIFKKPQKYLGPSQFATALGLNPFQSVEQLRNRIENGISEKINSNMKFGNDYEKIAIKHYQDEFGVEVFPPNWKTYSQNNRLGGIGDGFIYQDPKKDVISHGLEIKCHPNRTVPLKVIPKYYLIQVVGYMAIYGIDRWEFMSVCFNQTSDIYDYHIIEVKWEDVRDRWNNEWYPKLATFVDSVKWAN